MPGFWRIEAIKKHRSHSAAFKRQAADWLQVYDAKTAPLARILGRQALEIKLLKGAFKHAPPPRSASVSVCKGCELIGLWRSVTSSIVTVTDAWVPRCAIWVLL